MDEVAVHSAFWTEEGEKGDKVIHPFAYVLCLQVCDQLKRRLITSSSENGKILYLILQFMLMAVFAKA